MYLVGFGNVHCGAVLAHDITDRFVALRSQFHQTPHGALTHRGRYGGEGIAGKRLLYIVAQRPCRVFVCAFHDRRKGPPKENLYETKRNGRDRGIPWPRPYRRRVEYYTASPDLRQFSLRVGQPRLTAA